MQLYTIYVITKLASPLNTYVHVGVESFWRDKKALYVKENRFDSKRKFCYDINNVVRILVAKLPIKGAVYVGQTKIQKRSRRK
jgi:hypothetical protein